VVVKITRSRNFLVKVTGEVRGDPKDLKVVTEEMEFVGVIRDIIGRVESPYALVKVVIPLDKASELVGAKLYVLSPSEEKLVLRPPKNV